MAVINVILSGGVGSRLWPLSRKSRPKQYIPLFEGQTLFQMCALRNGPLSDQISVIGSVDNYKLSQQDLQAVQIEEYTEVIEALPRNTAASIAFAAFAADPEDILFVTPSDHIISGTEAYTEAVARAVTLAREGWLVTFGAIPEHPETGYGYIEHDDQHTVLSFKEKPGIDQAKEYVRKGNYLWNSGMFCFKASLYLDELKKYAGAVYDAAKEAMSKIDQGFLPEREMMAIPSISVDYAVMEHSDKIKVIPFTFEWNDLGSFDALWSYMEKKDGTRQGKAENLALGTKKHVEFIGLKDIIYVETEDAVLIMPRNQSQEVKKVYERLEKEKPELLK